VAVKEADGTEIGRAMRVLRARHGFSQETFGFESGLHRNYVGAVERGEAHPTLRTLRRIATRFDMSLAELFAFAESVAEEARR
jgi:transcriptional regulator with XRE-family HTH domain